MKKENDGISSNEDDNRSSSQKHSDVKSRKRNEPENEAEDQHGTTNNKKVRVLILPEPEPELAQALEPPASFDSLDDDCLGNVLDFVGKKCYSAFGRVNKRCHEMYCSKGLPKETYIFGYAPLHLIRQRRGWYNRGNIAKAVFHYNRRDILEWLLADESIRLKYLCGDAIEESRLDIIREVFQRANEQQLEHLRDCDNASCLCTTAAYSGKLDILNWLRQNVCEWDAGTWSFAKLKGHDHILEYLRNNGCPTEWQYDSDSESNSDSE